MQLLLQIRQVCKFGMANALATGDHDETASNMNSIPDIVILILIVYCVFQSTPVAVDLFQSTIGLIKTMLQTEFGNVGSL